MSTAMRTGPTDGRQRAPRPWTQPWFLVAAAVLAALLVAAVVLVVRPPRGEQAAPPPVLAPSSEATEEASTADSAQGSICGLPDGDQNVPVVPPAATSWDLVGTMAAPSAPATLGPRTTDGAEGRLRSCYARSPLGALYAATGFLAATTDPTRRLPAVQTLAFDNPGRTRALDLMTGTNPGGADSGVQVAGFTFLNYDQTSAVLDVALRADGAAVHLPVSLRWAAGDWKFVLPDTGQPYEAIQPLPDLTGYAPWSGA